MPKRPKRPNLASSPKPVLNEATYRRLLRDVQQLVDSANTASDQLKVVAHWKLGARIARERLQARTGYHNSIVRDLSGGLGVAVRTLQYAVKLHSVYPKCPASPLNLRHYRVLLDCPNAETRAHYEAVAIKDGLDSRALSQLIQQDRHDRAGTAHLLPRPTEATYVYRATVDQVIDGDTFDLRIDVGFYMSRQGRFRLADIDCPELPTIEGRRARDFVHKRLLGAKTLVVKTQRTDIYGRYVTHLFYSDVELPIAECFTQGVHLNAELLQAGHAELAV